MESYSNMLSLFLAILLSLSSTEAITASHNVSIEGDATHVRTYIIRVRPPENLTITCSEDLTNWYKSFLLLATMKSADCQFIYTYSEATISFAANLTEDDVRCVEQNDNFLQAYPDRMLPLSTTNTPDFLGLQINGGLWKRSNMGKGIVIGMVDDDGLPPSPSKWKGACDFTEPGCNNKVIRAIQLLGGRRTGFSLIDITGHGTRATSTAAGNIVKNVNTLGNANGTAAGTALYAHLAIYQVCDFRVCYGVDILARVDAAIKDGVDALYLAFGSSFLPFDADKIATGDFSAIEKEILVIDPSGRWYFWPSK